jgi:hypothetical protein
LSEDVVFVVRENIEGRLKVSGLCRLLEDSTRVKPERHSSLLSALQLAGQESTGASRRLTNPYRMDRKGLVGRYVVIYTIFEGTSEIQRSIIARAISGVHVR